MKSEEVTLINKKKRDSAFELLRIIAMVMIIIHHFAVHGSFSSFDYRIITIPRLWFNFIIMGGKIGVDIFVIISGYFLIEDEEYSINWRRIAKLWGQAFFYSASIVLVFGLLDITEIGIKDILKAVFPITLIRWWFVSTYFVLYLLHPFINRLLRNLSKKEHQFLLVCLVSFWCIIPTFTTRGFEGNNLLWFVCLYCIAAYIKLYGLNPKYQSKHYFIIWLVFSLLMYATSLIICILGMKYPFLSSYATYFYGQEKLTTLLVSLSLFMFFATVDMPYHKWINTIASTTFGVYLMHEHGIVRPVLWIDIFKNARYQDSNLIIVYSIAVTLIIFLVCSVIDLIRQHTVEKIYMRFIDRYIDQITKPFQTVIDWTKDIVFGENE